MSIRTDKIFEAECNLPQTCPGGGTIPDGTVVTDQDCNDPAFAAAHPELCDNHPQDFPRLIIKPGSICCALLGTVTFRTFVYNNGVEMEVLQGLTYRSSNPNIAIIGVTGGVVTGLAAGIATISVQWQDLTAYAQVTVVDDATQTVHVGTALMIDNSRSMGIAFGNQFSTRLGFAKQAASIYVSELNTAKDTLALYRFNTGAFPIDGLTNDRTLLAAHVASIPSSLASTNLADALNDAVTYLNSQSLDRRVIVLFTDGENKEGPDPVPIADAFKEAGGVIVVVGLRAYGDGFKLLSKIATGGFFLNATVLNADEVLLQLSGLKGYLCAGDCAPAGDLIVGIAALNYNQWINWDTDNATGPVDLIGGTPPYAKYDFLPGNGLYVDLAGSSDPWLGVMTLKPSVVAGITLTDTTELSFYLAGNQREDITGYQVRVQLYATDPLDPLIDQLIAMDDWKQPFTRFAYEFEIDTLIGVPWVLIISMYHGGAAPFYGVLLDNVQIKTVATDEVLFSDNFDGENLVFIPPHAQVNATMNPNTGAYYGYGYGTGCLTTPPGETVQDGFPAPDIE